MRFVLMPSLEQRALLKIAVRLWNQKDVWALIAESRFQWSCSITDNEWEYIEERVTEKVAQLPLPQPLKGKVLGCIRPIGLQILQWINFHCKHYNLLPLSLPFELCWTPQGTVDRKRTAEALVKDESLDISTRYQLACVYCLEEDIIALWNTLSEDLKQLNCYRYSPIGFWSRTMKGRGLGHAPISYEDEFEECAYKGNKVAAQYFLQKLTPLEREEAAKSVDDADTLCFLLSEMEDEQQMEVFKNDPRRVLKCFLEWPFQSFFMEIANCMWDFLPKIDYDYILKNIIDKVTDGSMDWNYHKLFREFWQKSPHALKCLITDYLGHSLLLSYLFHIKDKEFIRLILQDATRTAREKLIHSYQMHYFCKCSIRDDEWDYLEFCIRECFPSKDLMLKFKEVFEKTEKLVEVEDKLVRNKDKWDKLFLSSDDSLSEYEKRSADEGESSSSKRFCNLE